MQIITIFSSNLPFNLRPRLDTARKEAQKRMRYKFHLQTKGKRSLHKKAQHQVISY